MAFSNRSSSTFPLVISDHSGERMTGKQELSMAEKGNSDTDYTTDVTRREYMILLSLLIPTFVFGI